MNVDYFFASEHGDLPVSRELWARPFMLSPTECHPFLTLGAFLVAVRDFAWANDGQPLAGLLKASGGKAAHPADIHKLIIRYEKYGTLYQIVCIEAHVHGQAFKFAVSTAYSREARASLAGEADLIQTLCQKHHQPFLPRMYWSRHVEIAVSGRTAVFHMALSQWFDGYHEWHFSGAAGNADGVLIWDMQSRFRQATNAQKGAMIRQIARILTIYLDLPTGRRIHPWHHGAGDFIVHTDADSVDVRLVSVRGYTPIFHDDSRPSNPLEVVTVFLADLSLKMRLDKHEGVGDPLWAGDWVLPLLLSGFIEGLKTKEKDLGEITTDDVIQSLKKYSQETLHDILAQRVNVYAKTDPQDHPVLLRQLDAHCTTLHQAIQDL